MNFCQRCINRKIPFLKKFTSRFCNQLGPAGDSKGAAVVAAVGPAKDFRGDTGNLGFLGHVITGGKTWAHPMKPERKKKRLNFLEASVIPSGKKI